MDTVFWLLHWLCLAIGALVLFLVGIICLVSAVLFLAVNWSTVISPEKIYISRITGLRSVKWFGSDIHKNMKEYGAWIIGKEKLVLQRRLNSVDRHLPAFEIFHQDFRNDSQLVISFFSGESILVRKKNFGMHWNGAEFSLSKFQETHYAGLVQRATDLQSEIEKRFKPILSEASQK